MLNGRVIINDLNAIYSLAFKYGKEGATDVRFNLEQSAQDILVKEFGQVSGTDIHSKIISSYSNGYNSSLKDFLVKEFGQESGADLHSKIISSYSNYSNYSNGYNSSLVDRLLSKFYCNFEGGTMRKREHGTSNI